MAKAGYDASYRPYLALMEAGRLIDFVLSSEDQPLLGIKSPEGEPRGIRLAPIGDFSARSLHAFVAGTSAPGARVITDGWRGYPGLSDHDHEPKVVGATPAHLVLRWIHRVFSNLKRWALGTFHGLRRAHLRRYLDEFVFRWNRRRHTATAFDTLLGIGARLRPAGYRDIVEQRA